MARSIPEVKANIKKLVEKGAGIGDVEAYVKAEGYTAEQLRSYKAPQIEPQNKTEELPEQEASFVNKLKALAVGGSELIPFNEEIVAGAIAPFVPETYSQLLEGARQAKQQIKEKAPGYYLGGEIGTGLGAGVLTKPIQGATALSRIGKNALASAGLGAIYGAGSGEGLEDRLSSAAGGAVLGGVVGGGVSAIGEGIKKATPAVKNMFPKYREQQKLADFIEGNPIIKERMPNIMARIDDAKSRGVDLTFAEAVYQETKDPTLLTQARALIEKNRQVGGKLLQQQAIKEQTQIPEMFGKTTRDIGAVESVDDIGSQVKKELGGVIEKERTKLQEKARPVYEAIRNKEIPAKSSLFQDPAVMQELKSAVSDPYFMRTAKDLDVNSVGFLDEVKKSIDGKIGQAVRSGDRTSASRLTQVKNLITDTIDKYVPDYAKARNIYVEGMPNIELLSKGKVGKIAQMIDVDNNKIVDSIFSNATSEKQVAQIAKNLKPETREALVASYFDNAMRSVRGDEAGIGTLPNKLFSTARDKNKIALLLNDPEKYSEIKNTMEVLKAFQGGKGYLRGGSQTQPLNIAVGDISQAGNVFTVNGALKLVAKNLGKLFGAESPEYTEKLYKMIVSGENADLIKKVASNPTPTNIRVLQKVLGIPAEVKKPIVAGKIGATLYRENKPTTEELE